MTFSNSVQLKMIQNSTVSKTREVHYYHYKETSQLIYKAKSVDCFLYNGNIER